MNTETLTRAFQLGFIAYFDGHENNPWDRCRNAKHVELQHEWTCGYEEGEIEARAEWRHNRTLYAGSEKV